jgi:hypothetical protein
MDRGGETAPDSGQIWSPRLHDAFSFAHELEAADCRWIGALGLNAEQEVAVLTRMRGRSAEWIIAHFDSLVVADLADQAAI